MSIIITLKGRKLVAGTDQPRWHDRRAIDAAIRAILKGSGGAIGKEGIWLNLAARIEDAAIEAGWEQEGEPITDAGGAVVGHQVVMPDFSVSLSNAQAANLWREMEKLPPAAFFSSLRCARCGNGVDPILDASSLQKMRTDLAAQLGQQIQREEDETEEKKE